MPLDVIENEELWFRAKESGIADTGGRQVVFCALGNGAWIAVVAQHSGRLSDVTAQDYGGIVGEGIQHRCAVVRH